jgi:hypothetical protein
MVEALGGRGIAAAAGAFLLTTAPFFVNWSPTRVERFNERQAYFESANLAGFVVPDPTATPLYSSLRAIDRLNPHVRRGVGGAAVFLGLPVLIFGVIGLARAEPRIRWMLLAMSVIFLVLSLGPELKVFETNTRFPLPYRALMLVPPFDLARAPARLAAIGLWPLIGLQALGLSQSWTALGPLSRRTVAAFAIASLAWSAAEGRAYGPAPAPFRPPEELLHLPSGAVLNLPLSDRDSFAMFLQVFHGRPIATGHLSRRSTDQTTHLGRLGALLHGDPQDFARQMQQMGIATVVLARGTSDDVVNRIRQTPLHVVDLRSLD